LPWLQCASELLSKGAEVQHGGGVRWRWYFQADYWIVDPLIMPVRRRDWAADKQLVGRDC